MSITLRKMQYFLRVVDLGGLSKAAASLGVSQPTLSQQIAALESHLGQKLLFRTTSGVTVTDAGRAFYRHAQSLASQIEHVEREVRSVGGAGGGQVSLGLATCGAASTLGLPVLSRMLATHPDIRLRLNDNFAGTLSEFIMTGRIDLALAYTAPSMSGVRCQELFIEELFALVPRSLDLRPRSDGMVDILNLRGVPAVLPSATHFLRGIIDRACVRSGFEPLVVAEIDSLPALLQATSSGLGITILPRAALTGRTAGLSVHGFGPEPMEATVSLCTSAHLPVTPSIAAVGKLVTSLVQDALCDGLWPGVRAFAA